MHIYTAHTLIFTFNSSYIFFIELISFVFIVHLFHWNYLLENRQTLNIITFFDDWKWLVKNKFLDESFKGCEWNVAILKKVDKKMWARSKSLVFRSVSKDYEKLIRIMSLSKVKDQKVTGRRTKSIIFVKNERCQVMIFPGHYLLSFQSDTHTHTLEISSLFSKGDEEKIPVIGSTRSNSKIRGRKPTNELVKKTKSNRNDQNVTLWHLWWWIWKGTLEHNGAEVSWQYSSCVCEFFLAPLKVIQVTIC